MTRKILAVLLILALVCVAGVYALTQSASATITATPQTARPVFIYSPPDEATYDLGGGNVVTFTNPKNLNDFIGSRPAPYGNFVMIPLKSQPDHPTYSPAKIDPASYPVNSAVFSSDDGKHQVGLFPGVSGVSGASPEGLIISDGTKISIHYQFMSDGGWNRFVLTDDNGQTHTLHSKNAIEDVDKVWVCSLWPDVNLIRIDKIPTLMVR